jgi:CPA2 family monovalent cation:H+ antiporter-2
MDDGVLQPNPVPDYRFNAGDLIAVMGNAQQLAEFQTLISPSQ